jgi:hypothetical protein
MFNKRNMIIWMRPVAQLVGTTNGYDRQFLDMYQCPVCKHIDACPSMGFIGRDEEFPYRRKWVGSGDRPCPHCLKELEESLAKSPPKCPKCRGELRRATTDTDAKSLWTTVGGGSVWECPNKCDLSFIDKSNTKEHKSV